MFPDPSTWTLDGEEVRIDLLSIRLRTRALAIRKMQPPPAQAAWEAPQRLPMHIPWPKVWRIKSFYASPRDQITWLKVMHRNLYLAGSSQEEDKSCRVCPAKENIIHLVRCPTICAQFWDEIAQVMTSMGMVVPAPGLDREAFWLLGCLGGGRVVGPAQAGIIFIAWRCLYAEIVHSRVEGTPARMTRAHNRVWQMTITRLRAEGERWKRWHRINVGSGCKSYYPEQLREKKVMTFLNHKAEYKIHPRIMQAYHTTLRADPELSRRYQKQPGPQGSDESAQGDPQNPAKRSQRSDVGRSTLQRTDGGNQASDSSEDEWQM